LKAFSVTRFKNTKGGSARRSHLREQILYKRGEVR
jgi:hypothetical protein